MAEKEATVYIVDIGKSMGLKNNDRDETDLEWCMKYVWDKITTTVATSRKTAQIGVIALGSDETKNEMGDDPSYDHINIIQPISQILMPQIRDLSSTFKPSKTDDRDALSAIIIAVDMIMKHCRHLQFKKKIILVTNGTGRMDPDPEDLNSTAEQIKNSGIDLIVLGIDFDDEDYGFKEVQKSTNKFKNEQLLKSLTDQTNGLFGTMKEAIDNLSRPRLVPVRPIASYKGSFQLGDPKVFDTAISIEIERYPKTAIKKPPTASAFAVGTESQSDDLTVVHNQYRYLIKDETDPEGNKEVQREELAKGYEYGRTAVHISESDENITKLETEMSYDILGFVPVENIERYMIFDTSNFLVAQRGNDKATLALSSLIHALFELGSVAIGRIVKKAMAEPILTVLAPLVEEDIECLTESILPFAEDIRTYRFPPLDKVVTVSGKKLTSHRNLPDENLLSSMSDFVDSMILDEDIVMEDTYSPLLHTVESAIKYRAINQEAELQPKSELFTSYSIPSNQITNQMKDPLTKLIEMANVKKVPPKVKGRRYRDIEKPISGLDVDELFRKEKRMKIDPENAIPEFKQTLASATDREQIPEAVNQMTNIIKTQINKSFGDQNYEHILEELDLIRSELKDYEFPELYNNLLHQIKPVIVSDNRKELWWKMRNNRLGLIDQEETEQAKISKSESDMFWKL